MVSIMFTGIPLFYESAEAISAQWDIIPYAQLPHLMVNDQIYWLSGYPLDSSMQSDFVCIGVVEEEVDYTPEKNFQAYGISEGTEIYYDSQLPQIVYLDGRVIRHICATVEAMKDYLYHDGTVYVYLSSCGLDYESYKQNYVPLYGDEITVDSIPDGSIYIGETIFAGYNMFVYNELETNAFHEPVSVYQDGNNPNILYVGDQNMIYVPLIEPLSDDPHN